MRSSTGAACCAPSCVHALQRGEGEQHLLDAGLAPEGDDHLVVGGGGLAGNDDPFAELGVADVVAGGERLGATGRPQRFHTVVGDSGLEPLTSAMSTLRSNQLS